jgi:alanine-alpha-ketoisovalerate/valine-pyruvate aminotransferase
MHKPRPLELSDFGRKLGGPTGIGELMQDLGEALALNPRLLMMGGGKPARIPAMEAVWRRRMTELLAQGDAFERMIGHYDQPRGSPEFITALVHGLNRHFGWRLTARNVCVTNGSQNSFFYLFKLFLWLWLPGLQGTSQELYRRLKARNLLVVSGHHFFYGLHDPAWAHQHECLRLTCSQPEPIVRAGIAILADALARG